LCNLCIPCFEWEFWYIYGKIFHKKIAIVKNLQGGGMYFSGLRRSIQSLEEKKFYDIAIHFLETEGYKDLSIVDGSGDGGRDVVCSRKDMRIQLSIRKNWQQKINDEAKKTLAAGKHHFIYGN
jgi:HJR/Mrr/RecB family endonuclease